MSELIWFENSYTQTEDELQASEDTKGAVGCITIDGYPSNEAESGRVVCQIYMTKTNEFIIAWTENGYRLNPSVLELLEESKKELIDERVKTLLSKQ